jgi:hypothetical protein
MPPEERAAASEVAGGGSASAEAPTVAPLELLARDDKWQLAAGEGVAFVPTFPAWLDHAGFWDDGAVFHYAFGPLFTVVVLAADGRELPLRLVSRRWTPADLTSEYRLPGGITATEMRTVQPGGVFASEWRLHTPRPMPLHLVAWTAQPARDVDLSSVAWTGALTFVRTLSDDSGTAFPAAADLTCVGEAAGWGAELSDITPLRPDWRLTPFAEQWAARGGLTNVVRLGRPGPDAVLFAAVHRALDPAVNDSTVAFAIRVSAAEPSLRVATDASMGYAAVAPANRAAAAAGRRSAMPGGLPPLAAASRRRWATLVEAVPRFACSDPYLETYYWYRWYTLALNTIVGGVGSLQHPGVCEGTGRARRLAAATVPGLVRQLRWTNPDLCRSLIRALFAHQREDGSLPRCIFVDRVDTNDADDTDWGAAFHAVNEVAPDPAFAAEMYFRLARYAEWLVRTRDPESSGLFNSSPVVRATPAAAPPSASGPDRSRGALPGPSVKAVAATVHAYTLLRVLERFAAESGQLAESARWGGAADRTRRAVRERMWRVELATFCDLDSDTGKPVGGRTDHGFLPFATDLATDDHRPGFERTLLDPEKFWTPFPVPSLAADDPRFDAGGVVNGIRVAAPRNGRVWPASNCVVIDALTSHDRERVPRLRDAAAHLIQRSVRMRFTDGDAARPNAYEHYSPLTGAASVYSGHDDHQDGWLNDIIVRHVAGVGARADGITVDPLPLGLDRLELSGVTIAGHRVDVTIDGRQVVAVVDGVGHRGSLGTPIDVMW